MRGAGEVSYNEKSFNCKTDRSLLRNLAGSAGNPKTDYLDGVERIFNQIINKNNEIYESQSNLVRRADLIEHFLNNPRFLKIHDFEPLDFILQINSIETESSINMVSLSSFKYLLESPRDSLRPEQVNCFFEQNPVYKNIDKTYYFWL